MINYKNISEKYRPENIKTLLVGEAPPPSGKKYFYLPDTIQKRSRENNTSLPATIFYHYFDNIPNDKNEYEKLLRELQRIGVFLIDIIDEPLKIRDRNLKNGINEKNLNYLISKIPKLRNKLAERKIDVEGSQIIFLLARTKYKKYIIKEFPNSKIIRWKDFRMTTII